MCSYAIAQVVRYETILKVTRENMHNQDDWACLKTAAIPVTDGVVGDAVLPGPEGPRVGWVGQGKSTVR